MALRVANAARARAAAARHAQSDVNWWEVAGHFLQSAATAVEVGIGAAIVCVGTFAVGCVVVGGTLLGYGLYSSGRTLADTTVSAQDKANLLADWAGGFTGGYGLVRAGISIGPRLTEGSNNALRDPVTGRFSANPASALSMSRAVESASIHGNSLLSARPTTLYDLIETATGSRLKWGITSETNIQSRYSVGELEGRVMRTISRGTRSDMAALERWLVQRAPGPLNHESWAGTIAESIAPWQ